MILLLLFPKLDFLEFTKVCVLLWQREHLHFEESPPTSHHQEKLQTVNISGYLVYICISGSHSSSPSLTVLLYTD